MSEALNDPEVIGSYVGTRVGVVGTDGDIALEIELRSVDDVRESGPYQFFSVTLVGPPAPLLEQSSYLLRFPDEREEFWLLGPAAADAESVTYSASFSRELA